MNMVKILEKIGCGVNYNIEQTCCGHPAYSDGYWDDCKVIGEKLIHEFQNERYIVCPSSLCTGMIKNHYPEMFHNSALHNEYKSVQKHIYEFSDFLVSIMNVSDVRAVLNAKAVYFNSCKASHELNIREAPMTLLKNVTGLELVGVLNQDSCCGFGTTFAYKFENIAVSLAEQQLEKIQETAAEVVISSDLSCLMHMESISKKMNLPVRFMHLADVLASGW